MSWILDALKIARAPKKRTLRQRFHHWRERRRQIREIRRLNRQYEEEERSFHAHAAQTTAPATTQTEAEIPPTPAPPRAENDAQKWQLLFWAAICFAAALGIVRYASSLLYSVEWGKFVWTVFVATVIAGLAYLVYMTVTTKKAKYWKTAAALLVLAIAAGYYWSSNKPAPVTAVATVAAPPTPPTATIPTVQNQKLVVKANEPAKLSVPPGWRWDMAKPIPEGWTTDNGFRDGAGNRIQVFEVVSPVQEVALEITLAKCTTPQMCAW